MYCIILCGGSGTRLWPLSRKNFPKQFLNLLSDYSLLQETYLRIRQIFSGENIIFVTNKENYFNVLNQLKEIDKNFSTAQILKEPASLNTAPAITYAIKYLVEIKKVDLNSPVLVAPSDHYISNLEAYLNLLQQALNNIGDNIGTIGIIPKSAETGYGYIKKGEKENPVRNSSGALNPAGIILKSNPAAEQQGVISNGVNNYFKADEFKEKPDEKTAREYLESGKYLWNSGMYLFKIKTFINELKKYSPEIYSLLVSRPKIFLENFKNLPSISIDYAIAEKSDKVVVFEGDFGWSDIGSFDALAEILKNNKKAKHINIDSKNVFVHSAGNRLVATLGVEDLIVVENQDCILVQKRGCGERIKEIVAHLNNHNLKEVEHNLLVHRPWGKYEVLMENVGYKVKKITVYPGAKLSLQSHFHRVEHWIVVHGTAKIVNGDNELILKENESTFIPSLARHRLENPGKTNLEIIEVQTGHYLEEDDIIRYDDVYRRDYK